MTKRTWTLSFAVLALALVSYNASASRARNLVWGSGDGAAILGTSGENGSLFVKDSYNMFYNPSYLIDGGEWATIEKSGNGAFGGFTHKFMGFGLGFFFNRSAATLSTTNFTRPLEFLIAGDHGVKWGVGVMWASKIPDPSPSYAPSDAKTNKELTLRAGIQFMNFEPFAMFTVLGATGTALPPATEQTKISNMGAGVKYKFGEWTPAIAWKKMSTTISGKTTLGYNNWGLGIGRNTKLGEGVALNYSIGAWRRQENVSGATANDVYTIIPINLSASGDVTSWLTLRGGVGYDVMNVKNSSTNTAAAPTARFGASINVGAVSFDWAAGNAAINTENVDSATFDFSNSLFTAASLTYKM